MLTIWKFTLALDSQHIEMPKDARILTVQKQEPAICLWALVDPEAVVTEMRTIEIHGTGNPINGGHCNYIGTVQSPPFVWHVFERLS